MIYIFCFSLSALCAYLDTRGEIKKHIGVFGCVAILLPSLLAGMRDFSIGTDTAAYVRIYEKICGMSLSEVIGPVSNKELGFKLFFFLIYPNEAIICTVGSWFRSE